MKQGNTASAIDPVCGMTVDPARAAASYVHAGVTYFFCSRSCHDRFQENTHKFVAQSISHTTTTSPAAKTTIDPVCGMTVVPGKAAGTTNYAGQKYHFCSTNCQQKFVTEPERYTNTKVTSATPMAIN